MTCRVCIIGHPVAHSRSPLVPQLTAALEGRFAEMTRARNCFVAIDLPG